MNRRSSLPMVVMAPQNTEEVDSFSFQLRDLPAVLKKSLLPMLIATVVLLGGVKLYLEVTPPTWAIVAELLLERKQPPTETDAVYESVRFTATQAEILRSARAVGSALEHAPIPEGAFEFAGNPQLATLYAIEQLDVTPIVGTQILSVSYLTTAPKHGVGFLTALTDEYVKLVRGHDVSEHEQALSLLEESRERLRSELAELEARYATARDAGGAIGIGDDAASIQREVIDNVNETRGTAIEKRVNLESRLAALKEALAAGRVDSLDDEIGNTPSGMALRQAKIEMAGLLASYTVDHPNVKAVEAHISELRTALDRDIQSQIVTLERSLAVARSEEAVHERNYRTALAGARSIDSSRHEVDSLQAEIETTKTLLDDTNSRINDRTITLSAIGGGRSGTVVSVIRTPQVPPIPVWPMPIVMYGLATVLGLGLGFAIGLGRFAFAVPPTPAAAAEPEVILMSDALASRRTVRPGTPRRPASQLVREAARRSLEGR